MDIIQVNGSVEVAPLLNLSHWIVDLVDTGNTLRANGLVERETILQCGAVLVANRASQKLKLDAYLDLDGGAAGRSAGQTGPRRASAAAGTSPSLRRHAANRASSIAARMLDASALPVPAMSSAVP